MALLVLSLAVPLASAIPLSGGASGPGSGGLPSPIFLNLSATSTPGFFPNTLTVSPGAPVKLKITQAADFDHTFTLSPVANYTFPLSDQTADLYAFFNAHPPLVNVSLGPTVGAVYWANFTAPSVGTYEFVCEMPGHFSSGMYGTLVSTNGDTGGSGGSSFFTPTTELLLAFVIVILVVAGIVIAWRGQRRPPATPNPPPP